MANNTKKALVITALFLVIFALVDSVQEYSKTIFPRINDWVRGKMGISINNQIFNILIWSSVLVVLVVYFGGAKLVSEIIA